MFESAELGHRIDKARFREESPALRQALLEAQYELRERGDFPVIIMLNGFDGAGRSETMNLLSSWLDPRLIQIHTRTSAFADEDDDNRGRPWLWRYWRALPPKGRIGLMYGSWYSDILFGQVNGHLDSETAAHRVSEVLRLERQLVAEGALIIKLWLHLSREKQKKRLKALEHDPATRWRVRAQDWRHYKQYADIRRHAEHILRRTSTGEAPWVIVEGEDDNYRHLTIGHVILQALRARLDAAPLTHPRAEAPPLLPPLDGLQLLDTLQLDQPMGKADYQRELEHWQARLNRLTRHPDFARRALVAVFEGNDAAGKGGAIRRIATALDARAYRIVPIAAPSEDERAMPWLWRFWRQAPSHGNITIFDRSWYGRVLVERVEGFAREHEWLRAYGEINDFEHQLADAGVMVVKFWLAISHDEQLARFQAREQTGFKRFKITEEDWRNREKWLAYKDAVCDMIDRTSTQTAPWTLVEANNKHYARIKVLRTLCERLENQLDTTPEDDAAG